MVLRIAREILKIFFAGFYIFSKMVDKERRR